MLEREIKQLLSKEQYEEMLNRPELAGWPAKRNLQINYYYDTRDFLLYRHDITFRVRQKDAALQMEIKYPVEINDTYKVKEEISRPLTDFPMEIELDEPFGKVYVNAKVHLIQPLVTERTRIQATPHVQLDIDKSSYLGITDYELEIEFEDGHYEEAYAIFKSIFPYEQNHLSGGKNSRFFDRYLKLTGMVHYIS